MNPQDDIEKQLGLLKRGLGKMSDRLHITPTYSQVFVSPVGDWTKALSNYVGEMSNEAKNSWVAPCWVQGPFTSPFNAGGECAYCIPHVLCP